MDYYSIDPTSFRYISHHGILGQKWGVRRYQNPDGTLTELGKKRAAKELVEVNKKTQKTEPYQVGSNNSKLIADAIEKNRPIYAQEKRARKAYEKFESDFKSDKELVQKHLEYAYFWDGVPLDNILTASRMERERGEPLPDGTHIPTYKNFNFNKSLPKMMNDKYCLQAAFNNYCSGRYALGDKRSEQAHKQYEQLSQRLRKAEMASFKVNSELGESIVGQYGFTPVTI